MARKKIRKKNRKELIDISDVDMSQFFVPAENLTFDEYSVFYNPLNGKVETITPYLEEHSGNYIVCDFATVKPLLEEREDQKNYIVAIDSSRGNKLNLIKKDQWLRTLTLADEITDVERLDEQDWSKEFLIWIYTDQRKVEVMLNLNALSSFFQSGPGGESLLGVANLDKLTLYFVDKHDPGIIYHKLDINAHTLVNDQFVLDDIDDWWRDDLTKRIAIKTKKNFSKYGFTIEDKFIDHKTTLIYNRTQFKANHKASGRCHFNLSIDDETGKVYVQSNIVDPHNYRLYKDLSIHVVDKGHPDYYHGTITCPLDQIRDCGRVLLDATIDRDKLNDYDFLFDNPYVTIGIGDTK